MNEKALLANPPVDQNPPEGYIQEARSKWGSKQETYWA